MAKPPPSWNELSDELKSAYTNEQKIPVTQFYINDSAEQAPPVWSKDILDSDIKKVEARDPYLNTKSYDTISVSDLYNAVLKYPVNGKDVLVIGSRNPWIEVVCIGHGAASVTTVDYNIPKCDNPRIRCICVDQHTSENKLYDCVFSFSSIEHDGLGRYGDPIEPNADLKSMSNIASKLSNNGLLYLGVPIGFDRLEYNAHRIYGPVRWPLLINGFSEIDSFSAIDRQSFFKEDRSHTFQPWVVLKKLGEQFPPTTSVNPPSTEPPNKKSISKLL